MLSKVLGDYETVFQPVGLESQSNCGFCTDKMPTEILRCPYQTKHFIWTIRFRLDSGYIFGFCDNSWSKVATKWSDQCCHCACVCVFHLRMKSTNMVERTLFYFTTTSHTATVMTRLDKGTGRVLSWLRPLPRTSSACAYARSHWLSVKLQVTLTQFDNYAAMLLCSCAVCCNLNFIVIHDVKWSCGCSHCGSQVPAQSTYISSISQLLLHGCWNHPIQSECG